MRKLRYLFFLILFFIPFVVFAEEEVISSDITVSDLILKETTGTTEILGDAEIVDNTINLHVKMYEVGDSITYQFDVVNNTDKDYVVDNGFVNIQDKTIEYLLETKDHSMKVDKNTTKTFTLTATYQNEVSEDQFFGGKYDARSNVLLAINEYHLINPETGNFFMIFLGAIILVTFVFMLKIKNKKAIPFLFLFTMFIPFMVSADDFYQVNVDSNIIIGYVKPNPCTYDGELVQGAEYVNGQYTYRYMQEGNPTYNTSISAYETGWQDMDIDGWGVIITDRDSTEPVTTTLCTKINDKPIVSMRNMFMKSQTTSIDTSSFDTSHVVNMFSMFSYAPNLEEIDVSQLDMSEAVNLERMFFYNGLKNLDLSHLGGDKITVMRDLFSNDSQIKNLDMSYFNFGLLDEIGSGNGGFIFQSSRYIETINLTHANMSHVTSMRSAFYDMQKLKELDLSYADMSSVTTMYDLCYSCDLLEKIDLSYAKTDSLQNFSYCFKYCYALGELDLTGISLENVTDVSYCISYCNNLTTLDLSDFRTPSLQSMFYFIEHCSKLTEVNLSNWGSDVLVNAYGIVVSCDKLQKVIMDDFNFGVADFSRGSGPFNSSNLEEISLRNSTIENTHSSQNFFYISSNYLKKIKKIDMTGFTFGTSMYDFFYCASSMYDNIIELTLTDSDTSHVTNMSYVFAYFPNISIDTSSWDTSNVTDLSYAFYYSKFSSLDLSNWDVSNVTTMYDMFYSCPNLVTVDTTGWNPTSVQTLSYMFGCSTSLETLDLSGWEISNAQTIIGMFNGCTNLETLDITGWDVSHVNGAFCMFENTPKLTTIDLSGWTLSNSSNLGSIFTRANATTVILDDMVLPSVPGSLFVGNNSITKVSAKNWVIPNSFTNAFFRTMVGGVTIEEVDVTGWDLSNTTSLSGVLAGGSGLKRIVGLDSWDTSKVTDMSQMFTSNSALTELDLSEWDTSSVTSMDSMFASCSALTTLDLSGFNMSGVTNTEGMFAYDTALTTGYARTQADADILNATSDKPEGITFTVKA